MARTELLAPAGNLEKAKTAIRFGADAVYIGGQSFSLRSRASNFTIDQIEELCQFAHDHGSRVHVTVNMIFHPDDMEGIEDWLLALEKAGVDAIIAASPYVISLARKLGVSYEVHVSTQRSISNAKVGEFYKRLGADRIVLARENTLEETRALIQDSDLPVEVFIHGGMCISWSGRCVLSNHMTLRDANRGGCAQSCRWKYDVFDETGAKLSDDGKPFSMSSKDLNAVDVVKDLIDAGAVSFKIEGRMKSAYYLATVVSAYRRLIDAIESGEPITEAFKNEIRKEILKAENRPTADGFYRGLPKADHQIYASHDETVTQDYIADVVEVLEDDTVILQVKNRFYPNQEVEVFGPDLLPVRVLMEDVYDLDGQKLDVLNNPMAIVKTRWSGPKVKHAMVRKVQK